MHMHRPAIDPERKKWQDPEAILSEIGLKPGQTFIDVGCGGGFFSVPAAGIVGKTGKVYGIDSDASAINELREQVSREGLKNVELTVSKAEEIVLCNSCADIVYFGTVLHDFEDPAKVLKNARRMVKPTGRLVNLDWKKEAMSIGPPQWKRFSQEKASRLIEEAGFTIEEVKDSGLYHYMIIAKCQV